MDVIYSSCSFKYHYLNAYRQHCATIKSKVAQIRIALLFIQIAVLFYTACLLQLCDERIHICNCFLCLYIILCR